MALAQDCRLTGKDIPLLPPHPNSTALRKRASSKGWFVCVVTDVCICMLYAVVCIPAHCTHMHGAIVQCLVLLLSQCSLSLEFTNLAGLIVSEPLRVPLVYVFQACSVYAWLLCGSPKSLIDVLTLV